LILMTRRNLLGFQRTVRPQMEFRRLRRSCEATRRRWSDYRAVSAFRSSEEHRCRTG
jgi:hypothetical protein